MELTKFQIRDIAISDAARSVTNSIISALSAATKAETEYANKLPDEALPVPVIASELMWVVSGMLSEAKNWANRDFAKALYNISRAIEMDTKSRTTTLTRQESPQ